MIFSFDYIGKNEDLLDPNGTGVAQLKLWYFTFLTNGFFFIDYYYIGVSDIVDY